MNYQRVESRLLLCMLHMQLVGVSPAARPSLRIPIVCAYCMAFVPGTASEFQLFAWQIFVNDILLLFCNLGIFSKSKSSRMPRGGPSTSRRHDEEEMEYSMSQATQQTQSLTQAQRVADSLPKEVIAQKVSDLVQYMLIMEAKKNPVKRADLYKHVLKEHKTILPEVLRRAQVKLYEIFGYELVEVEHSTGKTKTKCYFLLNTLGSDLTEGLVRNSDETKFGLLYIILALIFMNEGSMSDGQMWLLLQKLGLNQDEKDHPVYGDVKKLITQDFVKQLYLESHKIPNTDPVECEYKWGLRAEKEIDKEKILNLVAEIVGENNPRIWKTQYREVLIAKGIDPDEAVEGAEDEEDIDDVDDDDEEDMDDD